MLKLNVSMLLFRVQIHSLIVLSYTANNLPRGKKTKRNLLPEIFFSYNFKMAASVMQRTPFVLRCLRAPRQVACCRGKAKAVRKRLEVTQAPKDYVYFLHNHTVPLHTFEETIAVLKAYSFEEDKETVTMCMKCQGLNKVSWGSNELHA